MSGGSVLRTDATPKQYSWVHFFTAPSKKRVFIEAERIGQADRSPWKDGSIQIRERLH
jgi:hypothetical protein